MTSEKLIELIKAADPGGKRQVYLQIDEEGNGHNPCFGVWACAMNSRGDVGIEKLTEEDEEQGYSAEDVVKGKKILMIQP
jgi:hypothetical protein